MQSLPRDVIKRIVRHMDIDSRRALGIYTRLVIPQELQDKLAHIAPIIQTDNFSIIYLGNKYRLYHQQAMFLADYAGTCTYYVCHVNPRGHLTIFYGDDYMGMTKYRLSMFY